MARRGRKKKNKVTYDSKEFATLIGLVLMIAGVFFLISSFTIGASDSEIIFIQARNIFGDATILAGLFLLVLSIKLLGVNMKFLRVETIIAQGIFVLLSAGVLTAFSENPEVLPKVNGADTMGGEVGYFITRNVFGDVIPTEPATKFILVLLSLVVLPIALSIKPSQIAEIIKKIFVSLKNLVQVTLVYNEEEDPDLHTEEPSNQPSRFGDFNNLLKAKKEEKTVEDAEVAAQEALPIKEDSEKQEMPKPKPKQDDEDLEFKEVELGEEGLHQEELKFPKWKLPPLSLLIPYSNTDKKKDTDIKQKADIIERILQNFNIEANVEDAYIGPSVIQYAINFPLNVNVKKISTLSDNLALALGVDSKEIRIESIPGTTYLGIEVPRQNREMVRIKELMSATNMQDSDAALPIPIGKNINGEAVIGNIYKMPHLLIAGATGSGKSVLTNSFITSLIMRKTPDEVKLILVDPKQVELIDYNGIPHLLHPVITDMDQVVNALKWAVAEMEQRYNVLANAKVRNIEGFNKKKGFSAMPYIVIVIDEMADMMMTASKVDSENAIVRLAQKARAVGIHLILATQRPSVNVITGIIKANIPGRVGMSVTSSTDSRVILDRIGAESLMGKGDLLYKAPDSTKVERLQGANIEQEEVGRVVDFIKNQAPEVEYITEITQKTMTDEEASQEALGEISEDNLVENAIRLVVRANKGSSSYLQRRLSIGFNRAARLLDELEEAGVVGPPNGSKPREVLISDADSFIEQLKRS